MDDKRVSSFWDALTRLLYKKTWSNYAILFGAGESPAGVSCLVWGTELKKGTQMESRGDHQELKEAKKTGYVYSWKENTASWRGKGAEYNF